MTADGVMENLLHASADPQEAQRELVLWFKPEELLRDDVWPGQPAAARR
jgi:nucleoside-diphosphate kinase